MARPSTPHATTAGESADFYEALQELLRIYQFRDRDRACYGTVTANECYALEAIERAGGGTRVNDLAAALRLPLFAVGEATAKTAADLGFTQISTGPGTGEALSRLIADTLKPNAGTLVHLAGETVAFDMKSALQAKGFTLKQPVLYRAVPATRLPERALSLLNAGKLDGVILMSPRTAAIFAALVVRHDALTQASRLDCYCLSAAVAQAVEPLKARAIVAARPSEEDILALLDSEAASS